MQLIKEKLYTMNKIEAESFEFTKGKTYAIISVFTPDAENGNRNKANFIIPEDQKENINILYSGFHDALESETAYDLEKRDYITLYPLSEDESLAIALFIKLNYDIVDYFVVHCEMGVSRSAGIVRAILKWKYGRNKIFQSPNGYIQELYEEEFYKNKMYKYNSHVYKSVLESLRNLSDYKNHPNLAINTFLENKNRYGD